ncbi:MAG: AMP-binding protein [Burkholderiaceae bacterium]
MHPSHHARTTPDKVAYLIAETGEATTYAELEARSNQVAHLLRELGVQPGDHIALLMENQQRFYQVCWGAQRAGAIYTAISTHLGRDDTAYIVNDCQAKVLITSAQMAKTAAEIAPHLSPTCHRLVCDGDVPGFERLEERLAGLPETPIADETAGQDMLYSSGTTGRPKGVLAQLSGAAIDSVTPLMTISQKDYGLGPDTVYLSPAPLYHAAPLRWNMTVMRLGGTCVIMQRFDEARYLALIEQHRVTHTQLVPTMFVRLLRLPEAERRRHDLRSLRCAIHAAAPCPVPVKHQMIDWWGPVLWEYYAGTEGCGMTMCDSAQWLANPGTVGKAVSGELRICDDDGDEVPVGQTGQVYFANAPSFKYHGDQAKTRAASNKHGWLSLGDIGYVNEAGYLFLTDRKAFMIISGGVNIYPQEAENVLITHPAVIDVAVFGIPNEEFGEEVKAVVQPLDMANAGPELAAELIQWCRERLSPIKCPRSIDFDPALPRQPNGKLYKRLLQAL